VQQECRACVHSQQQPGLGQTRIFIDTQLLHHLVRWASTLFAYTGEAHISIVMGEMIKQGGKVYSCLKQNQFKIRCRDSVVSIVTRLRAERPGVWIPAKARDLSLLKNLRTGSGVHLASYSSGSGVLSRW
jgi:hypothetical protein